MPHNRRRTEAQFLDAARTHLESSGFAGLGVNAIAEAAGFDKVLIYRYFKNINGLLERLAEEQGFFPRSDEIIASLPAATGEPRPLAEAVGTLLEAALARALAEPLAAALVRWEGATPDNPLIHAWRAARARCGGELRACCQPVAGESLPATAWFEAALAAALRAAVIDGSQDPAAGLTASMQTPQVRLRGPRREAPATDSDELPVELL